MAERTEVTARRGSSVPSLSAWVAGTLVFALVFVVPGLWIGARIIEGAILSDKLRDLGRMHDEWTRRTNDRLLEAEASAVR
jgi:hypothetical protein